VLILALETSLRAGSVALLNCNVAGAEVSDNVLSQRVLSSDQRSAQSLAPAIAQVLAEAGKRPADVGLVAVTLGPGSFTGLRVGATTAKSFAYAIGCECLGVDTLEVIAAQAPLSTPTSGELHAVFDAQRQELFLARFHWDGGVPIRLEDNRIVPAEQWLAGLAPGTTVTGPGVNRLIDRLPVGVVAASELHRNPQATMVGRLAWRDYQTGRRDDLWKLAPKYLRASAAEEKAGKTANHTPTTK
jgi:tRNA threonylcarbamoyladenosine biosynthesis protein TsaB